MSAQPAGPPPPTPATATLTELDKHVLSLIKSHLLEILAHEGLDWPLVPVWGDLLAQAIGLGEQGQGFHRGSLPVAAAPTPWAARC